MSEEGPGGGPTPAGEAHRYAEVLPDVTGLDRTFCYRSEGIAPPVGAVVRVVLNGRRVRAWVVGLGDSLPAGVEAQPILEEVSLGPPPAVVELARWAAWRFAGRLRPLLIAGSPDRVVRRLPPAPPGRTARPAVPGPAGLLEEALSEREAVVSLPPSSPRLGLVEEAVSSAARSLVLVESRRDAATLSERLRRAGWPVALYPEEWAASASSPVVVGTRNAVFAPGRFELVLVLDAHSESYRSERSPNFDARLVAAERSRRESGRLLLVSFAPPLELVAAGSRPVFCRPDRATRPWGSLSVLDSRTEDPAEGGYPSILVSWLRSAASQERLSSRPRPVVCILNRVGRARLLSCSSCRAVARCPSCGSALVQLDKPACKQLGRLSCPRCGHEEPALCSACGSARLRVARSGVSRAREQLEAVTGLAVGEMSGPRAEVPASPVVMATQAALHRLRQAALVAWLDFDQELLAPRFRAAEEALVLLGRSFRLVAGGGPAAPGRVVVRTSLPDHEVIEAARRGEPAVVTAREEARRRLLSLPPYAGLARVRGEGAERLTGRLPGSFQVTRAGEGYLVRAGSPEEVAEALAAALAAEPAGWAGLGVRVEMDPVDL